MSLLEIEALSESQTDSTVAVEDYASKLCMVCEEAPKQYKCPRCDYFTCSLKCCKQHKLETQCNGKRDRTAYIHVKDFKEKNLRSDFHFLEDILQTKDSASRTLALNCGGKSKENSFKERSSNKDDSTSGDNLRNILSAPLQHLQSFPPAVKRLAKAAAARNIQLVVMPNGMSKRTLNTTQYRPKPDLILWRLHIVFVINKAYLPPMLLRPESQSTQNNNMGEQASSSSAISITEEALVTMALPVVEETRLVSDILADFLSLRPGNSVCRHALRSLRPDRDNGSLRCLTQHLPSPGASPLFIDIPLDFTLKSALEGKTVIEYPTLIFGSVANTQHLHFKVSELTDTGTATEEGVEGTEGGDGVEKAVRAVDSKDSVLAPSSSPSSSSSVLEFLQGKKRGQEIDMRVVSTKKVRLCVGEERDGGNREGGGGSHEESGLGLLGPADGDSAHTQHLPKDRDNGEEEEEEEEDDEEVFLSALQEFEGKDIEALKAFIHSAEM